MSDNAEEVVEQPRSFDESYVKELRQEAASYRVRAKEIQEEYESFKSQVQEKEKEGLVKQVETLAKDMGMVDSSVVVPLLGDSLTAIQNGEMDMQEAITSLLQDKPYLKHGKVGKPSSPAENTSKSQLYTREQVANMSTDEINKNWHIIEKQLQDKSI